MQFKYKRIAPGVIRPIISVTLKYKQNRPINYEALVDSGADMCVFPAQIGELLGINIKNGTSGSLSGVIGKSGKIYYHDIIVDIGGNSTQVNAGFSYSHKIQCGFLGQKGIFNIYIVQFQYRKEFVELRPYQNVN
ncbi:MAG: hypothetical protein AAB508_03475 [Patescibacteria group bacterium]